MKPGDFETLAKSFDRRRGKGKSGKLSQSPARSTPGRTYHVQPLQPAQSKYKIVVTPRRVALLKKMLNQKTRIRIDTSRPHEGRFQYNPRDADVTSVHAE